MHYHTLPTAILLQRRGANGGDSFRASGGFSCPLPLGNTYHTGKDTSSKATALRERTESLSPQSSQVGTFSVTFCERKMGLWVWARKGKLKLAPAAPAGTHGTSFYSTASPVFDISCSRATPKYCIWRSPPAGCCHRFNPVLRKRV